MADWSSLPYDILAEIALKLDAVEHFIYFSVVCRSFNHACSIVKRQFCPRVPWLLLSENNIDNPEYNRTVFSVYGKRCFQLKLPQTFGTRCWGSSCGWFVTIDLYRQLYLFNPLTKAQISLPPQSTLPNQPDEDDDTIDEDDTVDEDDLRDNKWYCKYFLFKAVVLELAPGDFFVLAIGCAVADKRLCYARPGDQTWTSLEVELSYNKVLDVCRVGSTVYILYHNGKLGSFNISEARCSQPLILVDYSDLDPPHTFSNKVYIDGLYLVESYGHLLMVLRYKQFVMGDHSRSTYRTTNFEVYRLDVTLQKWQQLNDLGEVALFVGDNQSMSVHAVSGNCKCNSIYFTDDEIEYWDVKTKSGICGGRDMGVFDMQSGEIEKFYDGQDMCSELCTPLWFLPNF